MPQNFMNDFFIAFVLSFFIQKVLETLDPFCFSSIKDANAKKTLLGVIAAVLGGFISFAVGYDIMKSFVEPATIGFWTKVVTGVVIANLTDFLNTIQKYLTYLKETQKETAQEAKKDTDTVKESDLQPTLMP